MKDIAKELNRGAARMAARKSPMNLLAKKPRETALRGRGVGPTSRPPRFAPDGNKPGLSAYILYYGPGWDNTYEAVEYSWLEGGCDLF